MLMASVKRRIGVGAHFLEDIELFLADADDLFEGTNGGFVGPMGVFHAVKHLLSRVEVPGIFAGVEKIKSASTAAQRFSSDSTSDGFIYSSRSLFLFD